MIKPVRQVGQQMLVVLKSAKDKNSLKGSLQVAKAKLPSVCMLLFLTATQGGTQQGARLLACQGWHLLLLLAALLFPKFSLFGHSFLQHPVVPL